MLSKSTIKYIQSLQHKKFRDQYHAFVAEGPKVVEGLLHSGKFEASTIIAVETWIENLDRKVYDRISDRITIVKDFELEKVATYTSANSVVAIFNKPDQPAPIVTGGKFTIVLDDIQDPGNLGTIIRLADWFGVEHIICSPNTVDMYNNKVVQSTMASLGQVNVVYTSLPEFISAHKNVGVYAATLDGISLTSVKGIKEGIIVIGNESKGVSAAVLDLANKKITIPKFGEAESLNAAVATGIIISQLKI
jgi:RNA methyltransferase, TrmH family